MSSAVLVEQQDRWLVSVDQVDVTQCCFDYAVTVTAGNGLQIRIEQPFVFRTPDGREQLLVPAGDPVRLAPILAVSRLTMSECVAFKDGHLEIRFTDASLISVPATEDLEPWELSGPDGLKVVSVPGGELAVWKPTVD